MNKKNNNTKLFAHFTACTLLLAGLWMLNDDKPANDVTAFTFVVAAAAYEGIDINSDD